MDDILARLEHAKKTIIDLEKKKLDLTQEERRLKELYDEEELKYKTTVSFSVIHYSFHYYFCSQGE